MKRYGRNPSKRAPARKRVAKRVPRKKTTLVKTIKRVLHSQVENKHYFSYTSNSTIATASSTVPYYVQMMPVINQGNSDNARIANSVNVVKATIRGFVNIKQFNALSAPMTNDIYVKMWLCKRKQFNSLNTALNIIDFNPFFNTGASSIGFQGNMLDMVFYPNNDVWTVLGTKQFLLSNGNQLSSGASLSANSSGALSSKPFSFEFAKHLGKLRFDDNVSGYPTNKELVLVCQCVDAQGVSYTSTVGNAELHYAIDIQYEDA